VWWEPRKGGLPLTSERAGCFCSSSKAGQHIFGMPSTSSRDPDSLAKRLRGVGPLGLVAIALIVVGSLAGPMVGALLVLAWAWLSATPLAVLGVRAPPRWSIVVLQGVTLGIALKVVSKVLIMPLLHAPPTNATYHYLEGNAAALPGVVLTILVWASVSEELVFRGYVFERMGRWLGSSSVSLVATVLISTALFASAHYPDQRWPGVQQAVLTGLVFGSVFAWRGDLAIVIVAHAAYDLLAVSLIYLGWESRVAHLLFR
jgi:membrane protease YdiL (CAAX protease family)